MLAYDYPLGGVFLSDAVEQKNSFDTSVRETAGASGAGTASQLTQLADLKAKGVLTEAEFEAQKAKVLASS